MLNKSPRSSVWYHHPINMRVYPLLVLSKRILKPYMGVGVNRPTPGVSTELFHHYKEMASPSPEFNPSNVSIFRQSNPSNILNGAKKGVGNLSWGLLGALGMMIAGPIAGAKSGYETYGYTGAVGGTFVGLIGGMVGAMGVLFHSLYSFAYYTSLGFIRTPTAVYSLAQGKEWDKDAEEWIDYDMSVESDLLLGVTEEKFIEHVKDKKSARQIYSPTHKLSTQNSSGETIGGAAEAPRKKKNVMDRAFYDILEVEPEATAAEIKKAYYMKAKKNHPDRNPDNAEAKANFQKISQAYEVLGDETARLTYDTRGKAAVEGNSGKMDAGMLYTMIFGSENFETLIGELSLATQVKMMTEETKPIEVLRFRQRQRELKCAIILANKLDGFVEGDEQVFREKARNEAKELTESALGGTLLGLIGTIYAERASAQLHTSSMLYMKTGKSVAGIQRVFSYLSWGLSAAWYGLELRSMQRDAKRRQEAEDKRNNLSDEEIKARKAAAGPVDMTSLYGPNPTAEDKEKVQQKTRKFGNNFLGLLWQLTKSDIEETLKHVCKKVLFDHLVSEHTRQRRALALFMLGEEYVLHQVKDMNGIQDFLDRLGKQTGLFSEDNPDFSPFTGGAKEGGADGATAGAGGKSGFNTPGEAFFSDALSKEVLLQMQARVEVAGVKELKESIAALGGDASHCIEKEDLRKYLNELLSIRLSVVDAL